MNFYPKFKIANALARYSDMVKGAKLEQIIHEGSRGKQIYVAMHMGTERTIAIKVLPLSRGESEEELMRKGRIAFALTHDNIVRTDLCYTNSGCLFMHMEYLDADLLYDHLRKKKEINMDEALHMMNSVCRAIDYMHSKNITHGDIHEGTVMIDERGEVKVIGLGRTVEHPGNCTSLDRCKTRDYMQVHNLWKYILQFISDGTERISAQNLELMINDQ